jgi:hypothetical protein
MEVEGMVADTWPRFPTIQRTTMSASKSHSLNMGKEFAKATFEEKATNTQVQSRNIPTFGNHRRSVPQATVHSSLVALA